MHSSTLDIKALPFQDLWVFLCSQKFYILVLLPTYHPPISPHDQTILTLDLSFSLHYFIKLDLSLLQNSYQKLPGFFSNSQKGKEGLTISLFILIFASKDTPQILNYLLYPMNSVIHFHHPIQLPPNDTNHCLIFPDLFSSFIIFTWNIHSLFH